MGESDDRGGCHQSLDGGGGESAVMDHAMGRGSSMRMRLKFVLVCAIVVAVTAGCRADTRAFTSEDSWYRPLPSGTSLRDWEVLDAQRKREVIDSRLAEAESMLETDSIVELDAATSFDLVGEPLPGIEGVSAAPYLVRGLLLNRETGGFSVYLREDQMAVYHRCLGRRAMPMTRQPLVVQLERLPQEVYVTVSMAE